MIVFFLLAVVAVAFLLRAIIANSFVHDRTLRSRLTLTVETPEGVRTGSSVTEKTTTFGPFQLKRSSTEWSIKTFLTGEV
jgi:hypothetical protein